MSDNLPVRRPYDPSALVHRIEPVNPDDLVEMFLRKQKATTLKAYDGDLKDFARFLGLRGEPKRAVASLLAAGHGTANAVVLKYRTHLEDRGLSPATVGRRLAAVRSIVKLARTLGQVEWGIDVPSPRQQRYRDTRGPGEAGWRKIRDQARAAAVAGDPRKLRDYALVMVARGLALRRNELVSLDLADVEIQGVDSCLWITGKGDSERERLSISGGPLEALRAWIDVRGGAPGPLFHRLDPATRYSGLDEGSRLTGRSVGNIVPALGRLAGIERRVRAHGLRHEAITTALDRTAGDVRKVQRFSRHKDVRTLMRYDDNRRDEGGDVARLIDQD